MGLAPATPSHSWPSRLSCCSLRLPPATFPRAAPCASIRLSPCVTNKEPNMRLPFSRKSQRQMQLEQEIQSHLQMAASDRLDRGESTDHAQQAARREFGNVALIEQVTRDQWGWRWLEEFTQDLRYGARMLRKNPGFTFVAVLTLALGIGANTAIFGVVNAVLLRPLPFKEPERLVMVWERRPNSGAANLPISAHEFVAWKERAHSFESLTLFQPDGLNLTG